MANYVQDTGKVHDTGADATIAFSFPSLPKAGRLIVVYVWGWDSAGTWSFDTCADNQSNTYAEAVAVSENDQMNASIFYAYNIGTPSGTFTVTATASENVDQLLGVAVEYAGFGTVDPLDKTKTASTGNDTAPTTGASAAITQPNELIAALHANTAIGSVAVTTPTGYSRRAVETDNSAAQSGEAVDRFTAIASPITATWTISPGGPWTACLATFKALSPFRINKLRPAIFTPGRAR